jgi:hypothetical protein
METALAAWDIAQQCSRIRCAPRAGNSSGLRCIPARADAEDIGTEDWVFRRSSAKVTQITFEVSNLS